MLEVRDLSVSYGQHPALQQVSLCVKPGEIVVILGANGAGKSTLLRAIAGICEGQISGQVALASQVLDGLSSNQIVDQGIALVPEGRGIFADLSVRENLLLGAYSKRARLDESSNLKRVLSLFPKLRERLPQIARTMSGGEQQMVAIGRAMMSAPQVLMLDEPSLGLSPLLCKELFQSLAEVKQAGIGVLLVEQNARQSLAIADRGYLLENTRIVREDLADNLINDPEVQKAYLGAASKVTRTEQITSSPEELAADTQAAEFVPKPQVTRTADQQIGLSIDELAASAAEISTRAASRAISPEASPVALSAAASSVSLTGSMSKFSASHKLELNKSLSNVISEIEEAAATARHRARNLPPGKAKAAVLTPAAATDNGDEEAVVIEVYKRPRVEVYRRRADGQFERG